MCSTANGSPRPTSIGAGTQGAGSAGAGSAGAGCGVTVGVSAHCSWISSLSRSWLWAAR